MFLTGQGVVTPIATIITAATRVKKWSRGQWMFSGSVKCPRTIFKLGKVVKMQFRMIKVSWSLASGTIINQITTAHKGSINPRTLSVG